MDSATTTDRDVTAQDKGSDAGTSDCRFLPLLTVDVAANKIMNTFLP